MVAARESGPRYEHLGEAEQVEVVRRVAVTAAAEFGLDVHSLALVLHGHNTTFRVDLAGGGRLALRVNTNSQSTLADIAAQQDWCLAIARDTDVVVPRPVATPDGRLVVEVESPTVGARVPVVLNSWLAGDDVGQCSREQARALGATMAHLHEHATSWSPPPGTSFPAFDEPLFGDDDVLTGNPRLTAEGREVVRRGHEASARSFATAGGLSRAVPLHADLHGGNLKWDAGRLAVFDFDDSGSGVPALDLAVATFYLRDGTDAAQARETALREGYAGVSALPVVDESTFEGLVAARQLLLANALLLSSTAAFRAEALPYLAVTVDRLRHWLTTGRFSLAPGAAPA